MTTFPGPRGLPLIGAPWAVRTDPLAGMIRLADVYGDISEFRIGPRHVVFLAHPDLVEEILVKRRHATIKDTVTQELSGVLGNGLVTSEGEFWKTQRKAIAPSFQPRQLAGYAEAMVRSAQECLPPAEALDVHAAMSKVTLHIVIRTIFGAEPEDEAGQVGELIETLMHSFFREQRSYWRLVPKWVPAAHRRVVPELRASLDKVVYALIDRARNSGESDSLLGRLLAARHEDGKGMDDLALRDELVTLFLAGHETTSLWLSFAIWLLAEHPEVQEHARGEVDAVLGKRSATLADLDKLPYLDAVLSETLRLYPPVWAIAREVTESIELGPGTVHPGTQVVMSAWTLHRDSRWWVGPERFRPERWLNGETKDLPRMAFLPFGGGARVCVGNHFAKMEAVFVLATLLQHRTIHTVPGYKPVFMPSVTLRPAQGVQVRLADRG